MITISFDEFRQDLDRFFQLATTEPVAIMSPGRDTVLVSSAEYRRLKRRDREVLGPGDFTEADIEAIRNSCTSPEAALYNDEVDS